jgi:hypothetical protein
MQEGGNPAFLQCQPANNGDAFRVEIPKPGGLVLP